MGGTPCAKVIINSREIIANLDRLAALAEMQLTNLVPDSIFDYKDTEKTIAKLDQLAAETKTLADFYERKLRRTFPVSDVVADEVTP